MIFHIVMEDYQWQLNHGVMMFPFLKTSSSAGLPGSEHLQRPCATAARTLERLPGIGGVAWVFFPSLEGWLVKNIGVNGNS